VVFALELALSLLTDSLIADEFRVCWVHHTVSLLLELQKLTLGLQLGLGCLLGRLLLLDLNLVLLHLLSLIWLSVRLTQNLNLILTLRVWLRL
jgi:hypothetical protein